MDRPDRVLMRAALQLYADGHVDIASDLRQLAAKYRPVSDLVLIDDRTIHASTITITDHAPTTDTTDDTH